MVKDPRRRLRLLLALTGAAVLLCAGVFVLRRPRSRESDFPRRSEDFLSPAKLAAELAEAEARLKEDPEDIQSQVRLGVLQFQRGREHYIEGANALEEARSLGATEERLFYYLGAMYEELGLDPFASAEYRRFLRHFPGDRDARLRAARLEYRQGRYAEAVQDYERLHAERPEDELVRENLALSLMAAGRSQEARPHLEALARDAGAGAVAHRSHFQLGRLAFQNKEYNLAASFLERAQGDGSGLAGVDGKDLYLMLAQSYSRLKLHAKARPAWERVLALDPGNREAKAELRRKSAPSSRQTRGDAGGLRRRGA